MSKFDKLRDKHVLIFGGSSGIGFGVAEGAIHAGARVTISSSNQARIDAALERLRASLPSACVAGFVCNLRSDASLENDLTQLFERAAAVAPVNHVVYSAGDDMPAVPIDGVTVDMVRALFGVRFVGAVMAAKVAARFLPKSVESNITLTGGCSSRKPTEGLVMSSTVTSAVEGFCRAAAVDMKPIRVNCVHPGPVYTEMWDMMGKEFCDQMEPIFKAKMLTGAIAKPEDLAETYLALMKDRGVTGHGAMSTGGVELS